MLQLSNLKSLVKKRKRIGRGGNRGGTSGRGHKGQKARTGHSKVRADFEGGQIPLTRRLPKRGFNNVEFGTAYAVTNLKELERLFESGALINKDALFDKGLLKGPKKTLVKILGHGKLSKKFVIHADAFSKSAVEEIKRSGGEVHITKES